MSCMFATNWLFPPTHEYVQSIATHHHKQSMWFIKGIVGNIMVGEWVEGVDVLQTSIVRGS